jgi:putative endonuclease
MIQKTFQAKKKNLSVSIGKWGEEMALKYLMKKGHMLVARNYRIPGGELDLITMNNGILVFVEVKLRQNKDFGPPEEALNYRKRQKILRTIFTYLEKENVSIQPRPVTWQLDLIAIEHKPGARKGTIKHFQNILVA